MSERLQRFLPLYGEDNITRLKQAHVVVVGLGGVGSHAAEALVRAGVAHMTLIDGDNVALSDFNRQLPALTHTIGRYKTDVLAERFRAINPDISVRAVRDYISADAMHFTHADYVFDATDSIDDKIALIAYCVQHDIPVLTACGQGNRMDPTRLKVCDLFATQGDPLAKKLRKQLRKRGIETVETVFSEETPLAVHSPPASSPFVPPAAGLVAAHHIVKRLKE